MTQFDAAQTPIRYGILLDEHVLNAWQAETLRRLGADGGATLAVLVIRGRDRSPQATRRGLRPSVNLRRGLGGAILDWYGRRLSRAKAMRPSAGVPGTTGLPVIVVAPVTGERSMLDFRPEDVTALKAHRLDVLLNLGVHGLGGDALEAARYGVWTLRHGEADEGHGGRAGFWEIVHRKPVIPAVLERLSADGGVPLRQGWFQVAPQSYALTRDRVLFGTASWPALACLELHRGILRTEQAASTASGVVRREPGLRHLLQFLGITAESRLRRLWHHGMRHDDWNIGVIDAPVASLIGRQRVADVRWAPTRRGRYAADPFGRWDGGSLTVFFEDYAHSEDRASIAVRPWSREAGWGRPRTALETGTHLSYPLLIDHEGRRLMLPESRATGRLVLYETDERGGWQVLATLDVPGDVGDATLLRHADRWWLFAVPANRLNPATELMVWFADRPEGPWSEHPRNPVTVDVRCARPGGPLFTVEGLLYRPAQDCSTGYGDRLTLKRVVALTTDRFEEETVGTLGPELDGPFPYGLHTLTSVGDVTLVDGKRRVWDTRATMLRIRRRLPF